MGLACKSSPFSDPCAPQLIKRTSQELRLLPVYNRYYAHTCTPAGNTLPCPGQQVLPPTEVVNEYWTRQSNYGHPCVCSYDGCCQGNVLSYYTLICHCDHLHSKRSRLVGHPVHHKVLYGQESQPTRKQPSQQNSSLIHFPPPLEARRSAHHDTLDERDIQHSRRAPCQAIPRLPRLTTTEVREPLSEKASIDDALKIRVQAQRYQALKNNNKDYKKQWRQRGRNQPRSPEPTHPLVQKGFGTAVRKERIKDQVLYRKDVSAQQKATSNRIENITDEYIDDRVTHSGPSIYSSSPSSQETSNEGTSRPITLNQVNKSPLLSSSSQNYITTNTLYQEHYIEDGDHGVYSFDHSCLPRIVAVHTLMQDNEENTRTNDMHGHKELNSAEKIRGDNLLNGFSSGRDEELLEDEQFLEQNFEHLRERFQVQSIQTCTHPVVHQPVAQVTKTESALMKGSCEKQDHTQNKNTQKWGCAQAPDLAKQKWSFNDLLSTNEISTSAEEKHQSRNEEAFLKLRDKIQVVEERIQREEIPYKKATLLWVKKALITQLRELDTTESEDDFIKRKIKIEEP